MNGKIVAGGIVITALAAGAAIYYLQEYAYYAPIEPASAEAVIRLTDLSGAVEPMLADGFEGIDAESSPLRFRGCFHTPMTLAMLSETYVTYEGPTPLIAPNWFSCFDANRIGEDLETGAALAFLSEKNIHPGVDRVVAVYPDGRAYAWQQLNESAEK
ncbi:MAG: histidine kinase [Rhodobacteraceae bacterium]|nr:histidine kinase [Paracoccaceae bacterium]